MTPLDLAVVRVELRAVTAAAFPSSAMRALHGFVHLLLHHSNPALAARVHDAQEMPLTLAPLVLAGTGAPVGDACPAGTGAVTTINTLTPDVTAAVAGALDTLTARGAPVLLGHGSWRLDTWHLSAPAGALAFPRTHADLAAAHPVRVVHLAFDTPTTFRRAGDHLLHPGPHQVFGGYLRRWNALTGIPLGIDLAAIDAGVVLDDCATAPACAHLAMSQHPGFTGWARYRVTGDAALAGAVATLAGFAPYCGTGARTAWGMGQTRCRVLAADPEL